MLKVSVVMDCQRGLGVHTMNMLQVSRPSQCCVLRVFLSVNVPKCVYPQRVYISFYECVVIRFYLWAASVCPENVSLCCVLVCPEAIMSALSVSGSAHGLCVMSVCQCVVCLCVTGVYKCQCVIPACH